MTKNLKNLKKNKKGFTLIEIIVVLVIMGILLAIAVPSVLGYVNKAREQQFLSDGRAAFLGAQSIAVTEKASGSTSVEIGAELTVENINGEINAEADVVLLAACGVDANENITECNFTVDGLAADRYINIQANRTAEVLDLPDTGLPIPEIAEQ